MPRKAKSGEERNKLGKCYMVSCHRKPFTEITFYGKKIQVCNHHAYLDGSK